MQTLSTRDIATRLCLKPATVARAWRSWVVTRNFPAPIIGQEVNARPRWLESDFCEWLAYGQKIRPANSPPPKLKIIADNAPQKLDKTYNKTFLNQLLNFDGSNNVKKANQN